MRSNKIKSKMEIREKVGGVINSVLRNNVLDDLNKIYNSNFQIIQGSFQFHAFQYYSKKFVNLNKKRTFTFCQIYTEKMN